MDNLLLQLQCPSCGGVFTKDPESLLLFDSSLMKCIHCTISSPKNTIKCVGYEVVHEKGDIHPQWNNVPSMLGIPRDKREDEIPVPIKIKGYNLDGVGPEMEVDPTPEGGHHSRTPYRFDLLPPLALARVAKVLDTGSRKYRPWNWLLIGIDAHLNRVLQHTVAYIAGDTQELDEVEHLAHAACRALMALEVVLRKQQDEEKDPFADGDESDGYHPEY